MSDRGVSFDPLDADAEDAPVAPAHYLADPGATPDVVAENDEWNARQVDHLHRALATLDPRSRDIVESRWLQEDARLGLKELGEKYGVSAERVRQLEQQALRRLQAGVALA